MICVSRGFEPLATSLLWTLHLTVYRLCASVTGLNIIAYLGVIGDVRASHKGISVVDKPE